MYRLYYLLTDRRSLMLLAVLAALGILAWGVLQQGGPLAWLLLGVIALVVVGLVVWFVRQRRAKRSAEGFDELIATPTQSEQDGRAGSRAETEALRERMDEAVRAIKQSRLGQARGKAALYELPWYVIIGNPAAGKSSAILNSGLQFPFADDRGSVIQGIGGTRNCDWYFTTEGIVLDTAGRYTVSTEDRFEWMTFLDLLRKNRPRAPINGVIIAASIAELTSNKPEFAIDLARKLRQRVQELTERLEVFAPVYVVFTKADLISGFTDFFEGLDPAERENVWGATLPFQTEGSVDAVEQFDRHFDELSEGLKEMSLAQMAMKRGREVAPGVITLPLEFAAIKPMLQIFVATLFEENPYQFRPVFRGFYFTSALQEGISVENASEKIARRFGLGARADAPQRTTQSQNGYFLLNLFRRVVFADRQLVRQYSSPRRLKLRYAVFFAAALGLGLAFAGWTWSYTGNRQLIADAHADMAQAVEIQRGRTDLQSRLQALEILQRRLEQVMAQRQARPFGLGLGLYQGARVEEALREEYFAGMRALMLGAVGGNIERYLDEVVANRGNFRVETAAENTTAATGDPSRSLYLEASPTDVQDAYNALKTYLMLADAGRVEAGHLRDQLTRFWRHWLEANRGAMPREDMIRSAERLLSFHIALAGEPGWPTLNPRRSLIDDARETLRQVKRGDSARDRVYADIKARAATRFAPVTVASLLGDSEDPSLVGSHAVPGSFSRDAWEGFVRDAIRDAAHRELSSTDWVLETTVVEDLTLSGSPEYIERELAERYKAEYAAEWRRFLQGLSVAEFPDFREAVTRMNRIGDPASSQLRRVLEAVHRETGWDHPRARATPADGAEGGFSAWFRRVVLRQSTAAASAEVSGPADAEPGLLSREFAGIARVVAAAEGEEALLDGYLQALGRIRTRLNAIANEGDPGPGARRLMQDTLEGGGSELSQALHLVDERMLTGLNEEQRQILRPLLLRPLVQTYAALIPPTEAELNRIWAAQVYEPFQRDLADRYPFQADARVEAAPGEIARLFGPNAAIARFSADALGPLVVRRGNTLTPRQWADLGISLAPQLVVSFADWVEPPGQAGEGQAGGGANQTVFQIRPLPAYGIAEYSIEIDGQRLRYRNTPPQWTNFVWPNPEGSPGTRVSAVTFDGRSVEVANFAGQFGLERLFSEARRTPKENDVIELSWGNGQATVAVDLKVISNPGGGNTGRQGLHGLQLPAVVAGSGPEARQ